MPSIVILVQDRGDGKAQDFCAGKKCRSSGVRLFLGLSVIGLGYQQIPGKYPGYSIPAINVKYINRY